MSDLSTRCKLALNTGVVVGRNYDLDVVEVTSEEAALLMRELNSPFELDDDLLSDYPNALGINFGRLFVLKEVDDNDTKV